MVQAAGINNIFISGTGIFSNSSAINFPISPGIGFALPNSLSPAQTITFNLRGMTTINALYQTEINFSGGCSGTPSLSINPVPNGTNNPILSITGITCTNMGAYMYIDAGNLRSALIVSSNTIEIITPLDYGTTLYFVGGENQVLITAKVNSTLIIKVYPEKRIPATGNWQNQNIIEIRQVGSTVPIVSQVIAMNTIGDGTMASIDVNLVPTGSYDFAIKGYSHLRKIYTATVGTAEVNLNFTGPGQELLAGDTSVVEDNFVNSLDLSQISINLYSTNIRNDLNRDTEVNSLDLSNMSYNLYLSGQD